MMTTGNYPDRYNETKLPAMNKPKKKKKHPKAMHARMAAAFSKTKTSTPAEPDDDDL